MDGVTGMILGLLIFLTLMGIERKLGAAAEHLAERNRIGWRLVEAVERLDPERQANAAQGSLREGQDR